MRIVWTGVDLIRLLDVNEPIPKLGLPQSRRGRDGLFAFVIHLRSLRLCGENANFDKSDVSSTE